MPASQMTMPEATRAAQMHREGYSQKQIAQALDRSRKAIRSALRQLGVQQRSRGEGYRTWLALRGGRGNRCTAISLCAGVGKPMNKYTWN